METIIKGRKKQIPPFYRLPTTGEIALPRVRPNILYQDYVEEQNSGKLLITPYQPYIPLLYVTGSRVAPQDEEDLRGVSADSWAGALFKLTDEQRKNREKVARIEKKMKEHPLRMLVYIGYCHMTGSPREGMKQFISENFSFSSTVLYHREASCFTKEVVRDVFTNKLYSGSFDCYGFRFRSYEGLVAPLSLVEYREGEALPHVQAVVSAENYLYQKWHILVRGSLDMSRVVVLVNRELDSFSFPQHNLREFYKQELEPYLSRLSCPVWKVPPSFIRENCFLNAYQTTGHSIVERKREQQEHIEQFYRKHGIIAPVNRTEDIIADIFHMPGFSGVAQAGVPQPLSGGTYTTTAYQWVENGANGSGEAAVNRVAPLELADLERLQQAYEERVNQDWERSQERTVSQMLEQAGVVDPRERTTIEERRGYADIEPSLPSMSQEALQEIAVRQMREERPF